MLVETFALLGSEDIQSGLTFVTTSQYALLKELLERIWEAVEQLHDSSLLFYKGGSRSIPVVLQRMCFTEDALIFRLFGSLLKRLDDIYAGRYDMGISILSVHQGNRAICLFTGAETTLLDCETYRVVSLPAIKSLIGYAHHTYSAEATNSTIIIRLVVVLPTAAIRIYLVEPPGQFESAHYFDSITALSELGDLGADSHQVDEAITQWYNAQDYFTQIVASTIPTFCYLETTLSQGMQASASTTEDLDPEVQLLTESNCEDGTVMQLSWISGIQHRPVKFPRNTPRLHSPKTILQANVWRQIGGKLPDEALLDLQLYNAYVELDLDIGSKCVSRSESPVHLPPYQTFTAETDVSSAPPVALHVLKSLHSSGKSNGNDQLSLSAILEPNTVCTPSATSLSGLSGALCESSTSQLSRGNSDRVCLESNLSSEYIEATRSFIVAGEELKKIRQETEHLNERLFTIERSNMQQKVAIISNAISFWEQFLSFTLSINIIGQALNEPAGLSCPSHNRPRSNEAVTHAMHKKLHDSTSLPRRARSVLCRGVEGAKEEFTDLLPPIVTPFIQAIKHELDICQQLIRVYHALDKRVCSELLYNDVDLQHPDKIVARFLTEEIESHKKRSALAVKKISSISSVLPFDKTSETLSLNNTQSPLITCEHPLTFTSATEIQAALAELRDYVSTSMKRVFCNAECVQKSFVSQTEVKVCLHTNRKIKHALDQLKKHFEGGHSRTQNTGTPRGSSSSFRSPLESSWRIHLSIKAALTKLIDKLADVDALTPDIASIAASLTACKSASAALKQSIRRLMTK
ncbi:Hypothetical protein GLP15_4103 [Giardia lamblia P15]|uniref:Uncharacterized protein n=1 Tax=Giardia intestinalis (strain P15) TaxID=658858 RepID=E1F6C1_GIAIA|nr:Hypothetical protein GLP15_4103 [Giardia lamblia P15]